MPTSHSRLPRSVGDGTSLLVLKKEWQTDFELNLSQFDSQKQSCLDVNIDIWIQLSEMQSSK